MAHSIPDRMKAVIKPGRCPGLEMTELPVPEIKPGEVLVRVRAASICGTDLHIYRWDEWAQGRIKPPLIVGHEVTGEVAALAPDVTSVAVGDPVSLESHVVCNECFYCRTGREHICERTQIIGVDCDGGFAEYIAIPAQNVWRNAPDLPLRIAVLEENFGNAVHTTMAQDVSAKYVLVTGCGPVGVMAIAVAKAAGARKVFATDVSDYRLAMAARAGADLTFNVGEVDVVAALLEVTCGEGVDVLLEMSGAPSAIDQGFAVLKYGGEAALLGLTPGPFTFDLNQHVVFKGAIVRGIVGRRLWDTWYQTRGLLESGAVDLSELVTHEFALEDFNEAYRVFMSGESGKIMFHL